MYRLRYLFFLLLFFSSCTKDVDLEQAKDVILEPIYEVSIAYYQARPLDFFNATGDEIELIDELEFNFFQEQFVQDYVVKAEITFEATNSINRAYFVRAFFLDANDNSTYTLDINLPASPDNSVKSETVIAVFEGADVNTIKATTKIRFEIGLSDSGVVLDNTSEGEVTFKSKGKFYLEIKDQE